MNIQRRLPARSGGSGRKGSGARAASARTTKDEARAPRVGLPIPSGVATALWVLLLAWVVRNSLFVRQRAGDQFSTVDASAGVQIAIVAVIGLVLLVSGARLAALLGPRGGAIRPLVLYYLICVLSFAWSALPIYTLYRATETLVLLAAGLAAIMSARDAETGERTFMVISLMVMVLAMGEGVMLHGGPGNMLSIHAWHTNTYTAVGAVLLIYAIGEYGGAAKPRRKLLKTVGALALGAVVLGTSSASNVSVVAGLLAVLVLQKRFGLAGVLAFLAAVGVAVLVMMEGSLMDALGWLFPGKDEQDIARLGGRTDLWSMFWVAIQSDPIVGQGFGVFSLGEDHLGKVNSHNSFVAVMLATGALGVLPVIAFLWRLVTQARRGARSGAIGAVGGAAALATALVNSNAMPMILDQWGKTTLVFVALLGFMVHFVWSRPAGDVAKLGYAPSTRVGKASRREPEAASE